jgi:synaptobrevin family protein YKT6
VNGLDALVIDCSANPHKADTIHAIQKDLDETKQVLERNIEDLFLRGENLDDLLEKSEDISFQSKLMRERAEKMNESCCVLF